MNRKIVILSKDPNEKWSHYVTTYQKISLFKKLNKDLFIYQKVYTISDTSHYLIGFLKLECIEEDMKPTLMRDSYNSEYCCSSVNFGTFVSDAVSENNPNRNLLIEEDKKVTEFIESLGRMDENLAEVILKERTRDNKLFTIDLTGKYPYVTISKLKIYKREGTYNEEYLAEPHREWGRVLNFDNRDNGIPLIDEISEKSKQQWCMDLYDTDNYDDCEGE